MNPLDQTYIVKFLESQTVAIKKISTNNSKKCLDEELAAIRDSILKLVSQTTSENQINKHIQSFNEVNDLLTNYGEHVIRAIATLSQQLYNRSVPVKMILLENLIYAYFEVFSRTKNHQLHTKIIEALAISNKDKNTTSLANFINDYLIPNLDPEKKEQYQSTQSAAQAFASKRLDLLYMSSDEILHKSNTSNKTDLSRAAVYTFSVLGHITKLFLVYSPLSNFVYEKFKSIPIETLDQANTQAYNQMYQAAHLSPQRKKDLVLLYKKILTDVVAKKKEFDYFLCNIVKCNLFHDHLELIVFGVKDVYDTRKPICDFSIVVKNREIYDNIIPQIEETCNWLLVKSRAIQEKLSILKDFHLYIKLGNLDKIAKLPQLYFSTTDFESLIVNEIKTFQNQLDANMVKAVLKALQDCPWIKQLRSIDTTQEQNFTNIALISQYALSDLIEICRQSYKNLPPSVTPHACTVPTKTESYHETQYSNHTTVKSDSEENSVLETEFTESSTTESTSEKTFKKLKAEKTDSAQTSTIEHTNKFESELTLVAAIQLLDVNLANQSSTLLQVNNSIGFCDAIKNSFDHLDDFLTEARRFGRILSGPISKDDFFSTLVNWVNHGTLLTEQLLTALLCRTRSFKTEEDLKAAHTHQLPLLLSGCQLGNIRISKQTRNTIFYTNCGEIRSRNLASLLENGIQAPNSSVEGLLATAYSWVQSTDEKMPDHLIIAAINYFANILYACNELYMHIKTKDKKQDNVFVEELNRSNKMVFQLGRSLLNATKKVQIITQNELSNPFSGQLDHINEYIANFLSQSTLPILIRKGFENLQNNYLRRLKTELKYHANLPYKELRLHYCHVLLLNQLMAEEFFTLLINYGNINADMEEIDHNLVKLVKLLKFDLKNFSDESQNFLKSGKDVRALTRYRFSFNKNNSVKKNLDYVSQIAQDKQLSESGNDGFQLVDKKSRIKNMLESTKSNVAILHNLILLLNSTFKKEAQL